ncbi:hypothetical_protein [Leishmania braziliensis MHOM/BR/75/M2904]|uniref:Hypothetical_protein n=1 Tax=Leishmania braziliensis MHOM/BR/75/M2904 TaxID=420245 RepID=A0A3P3ZE47_LEIBR|nr:hypothetical_protein [Leishmania braziliensis MHOM/BR/75/M2904]
MHSSLNSAYFAGLHMCTTFLILLVSLLGTVMPIMAKYIAVLRDNPFVFTASKTAAADVLPSVSTVCLIHECAEAFHKTCVRDVFKGYNPHFSLVALVAVLMVQTIDLQFTAIAERWLKANQQNDVLGMDVVIVDTGGASAAAAPSTDASECEPRGSRT